MGLCVCVCVCYSQTSIYTPGLNTDAKKGKNELSDQLSPPVQCFCFVFWFNYYFFGSYKFAHFMISFTNTVFLYRTIQRRVNVYKLDCTLHKGEQCSDTKSVV